ncbi:MAG: ABC transporter permease [Hyphomonadaceae bacterium TMED5]|nr:ABC transporter permease [Ponticaulis sp.]OUY01732.1 MAG: ABC transporter permease [Hyphomonadaceae bacterium TMED5]
MASDTSEPEKAGLTRLFRKFFAPHLRWFLGGTLAAVLTSLAGVSQMVLVKFVGDALQSLIGAEIDPESLICRFGVPGITLIIFLTVGIVVASIVRSISLYGMTLLNNTGVQRSLVDVQDAQFASLTHGDFARLNAAASGDFVSRFINDTNAMRDAGLRVANNLTKGIVSVVGAFISMLLIDWQLTLILIIAYPIAFGPVIALGNSVRKRAKTAQKQVGEITSLLSEGFQSGRVVKAYGLEDYQTGRMGRGFSERARLYLKVLADKAAVDPILEVTGGIAIAGVLAFSAWRIAQGDSTLGDFIGFLGLIGLAAPEIRALGTLNAVAQEGGAAADRVFEVLEAETRVEDAPDAAPLGEVKGAISFEDVQFAYPDGSLALKGLSFDVQPGETVAIVGPSGAGKSTIFNLLLRLYDPTSGAVKLDGKTVSGLRGADVRGAMALVAQDAALFDDTVANNIGLGRLGADRSEIEAAARHANAADFIANLSDGYETQVGEFGRNLSGGQRQRIALARAILRDAPILLLDEATSALDAESEARVQAALSDFSEDRTTLVIAHRLSTVRNADRILVLEDGRVVENGRHDELITLGGVYARLAELQLS